MKKKILSLIGSLTIMAGCAASVETHFIPAQEQTSSNIEISSTGVRKAFDRAKAETIVKGHRVCR